MDITTKTADGILSIGFTRPEKKNAITAAMYQAMANALRDGDHDNSVRVIVLHGLPEIFTAGNDLEDFLKNGAVGADAPVVQYMTALSSARKPVIAAVAGAAVGIGTTLLMHCDMVYAAPNAKFSMPFSQLGLCPEFASSLLLQRVAGYQRAAEKLMLGEAFLADEALAMGLINRIVPAEELMDYAYAQAAKLAALPASSVRATKKLMKAEVLPAAQAKMVDEMKLFGAMLTSPEAKEAFTAFFEKRKPDFKQFG